MVLSNKVRRNSTTAAYWKYVRIGEGGATQYESASSDKKDEWCSETRRIADEERSIFENM